MSPMKRLLGLLVVLAVSTAPALALVNPVEAAPERAAPAPITGRVWDYVAGVGQGGVRLELRAEAGGPVVGTATTASDGRFSIARDPLVKIGSSPYLRVYSNGRIQGGWVGGGYVQPSVTYGDRIDDGTALGRVNATPAYIRGRVVNARTGRPVRGVAVAAWEAVGNDVVRSTTTNAEGIFVLKPIRGEDFNLRVNGRAVGYERGFRACNAQVVPTIGQACGSPLGAIGRIFLQRS